MTEPKSDCCESSHCWHVLDNGHTWKCCHCGHLRYEMSPIKLPKCRCYINARYYAKVAKTGRGTMQGYVPCPIHEKPCKVKEERDEKSQ